MTQKKQRPALEVSHLTVQYGKATVLWDVSFSIPEGSLVAIIGPNGAGKSTLLKAVTGMAALSSGKVEVLGSSWKKAKKGVAYVPQRSAVDWNFPITVMDVAMMGHYPRKGFLGLYKKEDRDLAMQALAKLGMDTLSLRHISQLSGGQQQKTFLARALVQNASLYLLDEPFAGVDIASEKAMVSLLKKICSEGKTVCVVHHDLSTVASYFDRVILLNTTLIDSGAVASTFTKENITKAFGKDNLVFDEVMQLSAQHSQGIV